MTTNRDETLEEIWAIRRQLARKFGYDPKNQVTYYQRKQQDSGATIYRPGAKADPNLHAADVLHDKPHAKVDAVQRTPLTSCRVGSKRKTNRGK